MIGRTVREVSEATDQEILDTIAKLDKVVKTHPQKSQKAQAATRRTVLQNELVRRAIQS